MIRRLYSSLAEWSRMIWQTRELPTAAEDRQDRRIVEYRQASREMFEPPPARDDAEELEAFVKRELAARRDDANR